MARGVATARRYRFSLMLLLARRCYYSDSIRDTIIQGGNGARKFSPLIENLVPSKSIYPSNTAWHPPTVRP